MGSCSPSCPGRGPVAVDGLSAATAIAAGGRGWGGYEGASAWYPLQCAIAFDRTVWCWGTARLVDETNWLESTVPVQVAAW
jgi:hypothetical protein